MHLEPGSLCQDALSQAPDLCKQPWQSVLVSDILRATAKAVGWVPDVLIDMCGA